MRCTAPCVVLAASPQPRAQPTRPPTHTRRGRPCALLLSIFLYFIHAHPCTSAHAGVRGSALTTGGVAPISMLRGVTEISIQMCGCGRCRKAGCVLPLCGWSARFHQTDLIALHAYTVIVRLCWPPPSLYNVLCACLPCVVVCVVVVAPAAPDDFRNKFDVLHFTKRCPLPHDAYAHFLRANLHTHALHNQVVAFWA
jgi:hypothetical protein